MVLHNYTIIIQKIHSQIRKKKKLDEEKQLKEEKKRQLKEIKVNQGKFTAVFRRIWSLTFRKFGEEWVILAILGVILAIISYTIDKGVIACSIAQKWLYKEATDGMFEKWIAWVCLPFFLMIGNVALTHLIAPEAAGSGIAQLKTSLRGVFMREVLTFRVLIVKWLGLTASIGSGLPLGKEGPMIHMSCIIVTKLSKAISSFNKIFINENKKIEMLGAAWAVGVACTFNAPIGGVLFSVEITTAYFAVRNYWRGFFAAVWGAATYRLLLVWIDGSKTITSVFTATYFTDMPYDPLELFAFATLGLLCGLGGSLYILCKKYYEIWVNKFRIIRKIKEMNQFYYPAFVILVVSSINFPAFLGQFVASDLSGAQQVIDLFSNFTWSKPNHTIAHTEVLSHWTTKSTGIYENLAIFIFYQMLGSVMGASVPIASGIFIPNFRSGAALGRIVGELMYTCFPEGIGYEGKVSQIVPGAYAAVGAASWIGAVTHTMSVCVILFEMTSSITYIIPVLIAVLIANGVARLLTPSVYDLIIKSKKLPYLPDLLPNTSNIYEVYVEDFMKTNLRFLDVSMNYKQLRELLNAHKKISDFPLVDHPRTMTLLGSILRSELVLLLDRQFGNVQRQKYLSNPSVERTVDRFKTVEFIHPNRKESILYVKDSSESENEDEEIGDKNNNLENAGPMELDMTEPSLRVCDLPDPEQLIWEEDQLKMIIDFSQCQIDPAPFQLVEKTSLLKAHSLFSLLNINFAYVTSIGRLVGVVGLAELRQAIEDANNGISPKRVETDITPDAPSSPETPKPPIIFTVCTEKNIENVKKT